MSRGLPAPQTTPEGQPSSRIHRRRLAPATPIPSAVKTAYAPPVRQPAERAKEQADDGQVGEIVERGLHRDA